MTRRTSAEVQADQDAAKWRALCAFLTDNGVDPEKITPEDVASATIFTLDKFDAAIGCPLCRYTIRSDAGESHKSNLPY